MKPFDPSVVKLGDELALSRYPPTRLTFRGMGFDGKVIAEWVNPIEGRPLDVIVGQRELLIVEPGDA